MNNVPMNNEQSCNEHGGDRDGVLAVGSVQVVLGQRHVVMVLGLGQCAGGGR
jgi:hypothetical protein